MSGPDKVEVPAAFYVSNDGDGPFEGRIAVGDKLAKDWEHLIGMSINNGEGVTAIAWLLSFEEATQLHAAIGAWLEWRKAVAS